MNLSVFVQNILKFLKPFHKIKSIYSIIDKRQCWFLLLLPLVDLIEAVWENEILKFNTTQVEKELDNLFNTLERKKERLRYDIIILILWNILNVIKIKSLAFGNWIEGKNEALISLRNFNFFLKTEWTEWWGKHVCQNCWNDSDCCNPNQTY